QKLQQLKSGKLPVTVKPAENLITQTPLINPTIPTLPTPLPQLTTDDQIHETAVPSAPVSPRYQLSATSSFSSFTLVRGVLLFSLLFVVFFLSIVSFAAVLVGTAHIIALPHHLF